MIGGGRGVNDFLLEALVATQTIFLFFVFSFQWLCDIDVTELLKWEGNRECQWPHADN